MGLVRIAVVVSGLALLGPAGAVACAKGARKPVRILFVGNSYTFVNDLPALIQAFLESKGQKAEVGRYLVGGASLRDHWHHNEGTEAPKPGVPPAPARKGGLDKLLKEQGPWDFVVLQGQSQEALAAQPCEFGAYAAKLVAKIREVQPATKTVFYMTWARQHLPAQQAEITKTYAEAAKAHKALLAPAGEAWKEALGAREGLVLHQADKSHPSPRGTYLTGCVFYATLTGQSPVGLPARPGIGGKTPFDLPEEEAKFLQETAWKTVRRFEGR